MTSDNRLVRAREYARAARAEFARAEDARGREVVVGLQNAYGKGWLAASEAAHAYFLSRGIPEGELPATGRDLSFFVSKHMELGMKKEFNNMRATFDVDGYCEGVGDFDLMPRHLDELDDFIETVAGWPDA